MDKVARPTRTSTIAKWIIAVVSTAAIVLLPNPQGLSDAAQATLATLWFVIFAISANILPDSVAALVGFCMFFFLKTGPIGDVVSGWANPTMFLLIGALGMGHIMMETGAAARVASAITAVFPKTWTGTLLSAFVAGIVVTPTIPSNGVKCTLMGLVTTPLSKAMGYKPQSRPAAGLFVAGFISNNVVGAAFMTGTLWGPMAPGLLAKYPQYLPNLTWGAWLAQAWPYAIVVAVGLFLAVWYLYKPTPEDIDSAMKAEWAAPDRAEKERMTPKQIGSIVVLLLTILAWIFNTQLKLDTNMTAIVGLTVMLLLNFTDRKTIIQKLPWGVLFFVSWVFSLINLMTTTGVSAWMGKLAGPVVAPFISNMWLFIPAFMLLVYAVRLVVISSTAVITFFIVALAPLAVGAGVNPWIILFVAIVAVPTWNYLAQTSQFLMGYTTAGGPDYISYPKTIKMSLITMAWMIVSCLACIPYWKMLGMLG